MDGVINDTTTLPWIGENNTDAAPSRNKSIQLAYDIFIPSIVVVIMFAMGCGVTIQDVKKEAKKPIAPLIGLFSQFIVLPATAFGLAHALQLEDHFAIGMIIMASTPGGSLSNIFTYWTRGDLTLSICMTLLSTVLALGFMPLNMFIYLRSWTDVKANIPFVNMTIGIIATWIPVAAGLALQYKHPKSANIFVKVGSVFGMILIFVTGALQVQLNPRLFNVPWNLYVGAIALPVMGFSLGFVVALIACLPVRMCRTVAFETGLQNIGLALSVIAVSYPSKYASMLSQYPMFYAGGQMATAWVVAIAHIVYFRIEDHRKKKYSVVADDGDCREGEKTIYEDHEDGPPAEETSV